MALDYYAISEENQRRYGTDIGRIGKMLLADRYDDRTHFIFELLQNAEDALGRRGNALGSRSVTFRLTPDQLCLSHFGKPFDEADVRGICGIAESTKDEHSIGRFGIGFKSVYAFTDRPEIHSGEEDFAVESYVLPKAVERSERQPDETQIILPLRPEEGGAWQEIASGFQHLGPGALLFLRHINEVNWHVDSGASGFYLRNDPESLGPSVHRVTLIGQESDRPEVDQKWLVFHRNVHSAESEKVGRIELAFSLTSGKDAPERVQPVAASPLVVFFPTVVQTNLGCLVQGPYKTTPSRDNVPRNNPWNQSLVQQTANLLIDALCWMRDNEMLDTAALRCLPTSREKFPEGAMFAPIFNVVRQAFFDQALLPRFDSGFVLAPKARLARTQELRDLFTAEQVGSLLGAPGSAWLTGDITPDKAPELRTYLQRELQVSEIAPEQVVPKLSKEFLESQSDEWITRLYAFLSGQKALASRFSLLPLVRLEDGAHVVASENGLAQAFLPGAIKTSFPTVRRAVCGTAEARAFLTDSLKLTEPNPVDDVLSNVLPRYRPGAKVDDAVYSADIERITAVFNTDSKKQRERLIEALKETPFVKIADACSGTDRVKPGTVYLATDRLKALFSNVPGVSVVDDSYECLRGDLVGELLEACGALRYPRPVLTPSALKADERRELRRQIGHDGSVKEEKVVDYELEGFDALLARLPTLSAEQQVIRAGLLWESLGDLDGRGRGVFDGAYEWYDRGPRRSLPFLAAFLRRLNKVAWVPDASGELVRPELVAFESLGWKPNPFLQSKITFKPPIIDQLAREVGIDPAAIDLLRKHGITSAADLAARLGIPAAAKKEAEPDAKEIAGEIKEPGADTTAGAIEPEGLSRTKIFHPSPIPADPGPANDDRAQEAHAAPAQESNLPDDYASPIAIAPTPAPELAVRGTETKRATERGPPSNGRVSDGQPRESARPGQRNIAGQAGLDEQAKRLGRRVASFFDGTAPDADADEEEEEEEVPAGSTVTWRTKLVCLDVGAGGLQFEIGPLEGLPSFVKKLRVLGNEDWDALVLATNAKLRPTRVSVRPGTGPWRCEAVGFEDEKDLGLDQLALGALDVTTPHVFRVDADGVGQLVASTTLSLGQYYQLLLPPNVGGGVGMPLADGWRIWSLDLAVKIAPSTDDVLKALGIDVGQASPRLEWAMAPASAWRTNARGASYPVFDEGTELLVNLNGVALEDGDEAMLFLHGPSGTNRLAVSTSGLVSLGKPAAGRWACALLHSRTNVQTATLLFEVAQNVTEYVSAAWTTSMPHGLASLAATAPPGWPVSVRWGGLAAHEETIATDYGNDDRTVSFEEIHPFLEARAARASVADLVVDFRELGRRVIPLDGRASLEEVRAQLIALWQQRAERVQRLKGLWLQLMPMWFEPTTTRLGYGVDSLAIADADAPHDLAAWLLTIDERANGSITRSPSRLLLLTTDVDSVLRDLREWIDNACTAARVRDAIVTDGTRWATHRKGDRQLRRREWSFDHAINLGSVDDMLNDLTEGW